MFSDIQKLKKFFTIRTHYKNVKYVFQEGKWYQITVYIDPHKKIKDTGNGNYVGKYLSFFFFLFHSPLR